MSCASNAAADPGPAYILSRPSGELALAFSNLLTLLKSRPADTIPAHEITRLEKYLQRDIGGTTVDSFPDYVGMGMCVMVAILTDTSVNQWATTHPTYKTYKKVFDVASARLHEFMCQSARSGQRVTLTQFFVDIVVLLDACSPDPRDAAGSSLPAGGPL